MPVYSNKDKKNNIWFCSFYYTDLDGKKRRKKKEGFATKREAKKWEEDFLESVDTSPMMLFSTLYKMYAESRNNRIKLSTEINRDALVEKHIMPTFRDSLVRDIKAHTIEVWQNKLLKQGYSPTYLKTINAYLKSIFSYAVDVHNLSSNPCAKYKSIGKNNADEMSIWTLDEFNRFSEELEDVPIIQLAFSVLFWTGIRLGELLALTWNDIDFDNQILSINKTYHRYNKTDVITTPKTRRSIRSIPINKSLLNSLLEHNKASYKPDSSDRIFTYSKATYNNYLNRCSEQAGLPKIRVHDLRHSHASMLIKSGVNVVAISKRLGHEKVQTTLNTYSHVYPNENMLLLNVLERIEKDGIT